MKKNKKILYGIIFVVSAAIIGVFWAALTERFQQETEQQISGFIYSMERYELSRDLAVQVNGEQELIADYQSLIDDFEKAIAAVEEGNRTKLLQVCVAIASTEKKVKGFDAYTEQELLYYEYLIGNGIRMNLTYSEPGFFNVQYIFLTGVYTLLLPLLVLLIAGQSMRSLKIRHEGPSITGFMRIYGICLLPTVVMVLGLLVLSFLRGDAWDFSSLVEISGTVPGAIQIYQKTYLSTGLAVLYTLITIILYSFFYSAIGLLVTKWIPSKLCYVVVSLIGVLPALPILLGPEPPRLNGFSYWTYSGIGTGDTSLITLPVIFFLGLICLFIWRLQDRNSRKGETNPTDSV